ncbi:unnamed protein product [Symbiodinium necroappetens]|uniref:Uncharacterized protein n=1 Tax=Symbiodinium necroappetens TaxID=1628268 RepID=A0A812SY69_9DINO|nr:unnamed protein product [Symbiodinium necroappetens]
MFELPIGTGLVGDALGDAYERATDRPVKFKFSCGASVHAQRMPDPVAFVAETSARRAHQAPLSLWYWGVGLSHSVLWTSWRVSVDKREPVLLHPNINRFSVHIGVK